MLLTPRALSPVLSAVLWAALASPLAQAFMLTPMTASLDPSGPGATRSFELENDGDEPAAVELSVARRQVDLAGVETQARDAELDKQLVIYPPQLILKAKEKRTVRVSWNGDPKPKSELAFRLIAEQLPVDTTKKAQARGGVIKMLLKYVAAVYVTPKDARAELKLAEAVVVAAPPATTKTAKAGHKPGAPAGPLLRLRFKNTGTAHRVLSGIQLKVTTPAGVKSIAPAELPTLNGQNILAGSERRFEIPAPAGLAAGPAKVEFELQD